MRPSKVFFLNKSTLPDMSISKCAIIAANFESINFTHTHTHKNSIVEQKISGEKKLFY